VHEKEGFIEMIFFFILASNKTISRWPWSFYFLARME